MNQDMISKIYHKLVSYWSLIFRKLSNGRHITNGEYWTYHNVTIHRSFASCEESLDFLRWRNSQYLFYNKLMPCNDFDDKIVLDFGCGPGNDLVGFIEYSKPKKVYAVDISQTSLVEAKKRLSLHQKSDLIEYMLIEECEALPIKSEQVDYIHTSGVLHHVSNIKQILKEFQRVLKREGFVRVMIYNYNSLWVHLYVAYVRQILKKIDKNRSLAEAFKRSTDAKYCPTSRYYTSEDFISLCVESGFKAEYKGAAISLHEMSLLSKRVKAISEIKLNKIHRDFLKSLCFDEYGRPIYNGQVAGIDSVYELRKIN